MMPHRHPEKAEVVKILAEVGRRIALDSTSEHPEDIAYSMMNAIETAGVTIQVIWTAK